MFTFIAVHLGCKHSFSIFACVVMFKEFVLSFVFEQIWADNCLSLKVMGGGEFLKYRNT